MIPYCKLVLVTERTRLFSSSVYLHSNSLRLILATLVTEVERVRLPVEAVHHLQVHPQVLLREMVQHARIHQALHEVAAVLR